MRDRSRARMSVLVIAGLVALGFGVLGPNADAQESKLFEVLKRGSDRVQALRLLNRCVLVVIVESFDEDVSLLLLLFA